MANNETNVKHWADLQPGDYCLDTRGTRHQWEGADVSKNWRTGLFTGLILGGCQFYASAGSPAPENPAGHPLHAPGPKATTKGSTTENGILEESGE